MDSEWIECSRCVNQYKKGRSEACSKQKWADDVNKLNEEVWMRIWTEYIERSGGVWTERSWRDWRRTARVEKNGPRVLTVEGNTKWMDGANRVNGERRIMEWRDDPNEAKIREWLYVNEVDQKTDWTERALESMRDCDWLDWSDYGNGRSEGR